MKIMLTFADIKYAMKTIFKFVLVAALVCYVVPTLAQHNCNAKNLTVKLDSVTESGGNKHLFEYDARLNCTRWVAYRYRSDGWSIVAFEAYTYDDLDRMTSKTIHNNGVTKYEYFYNDQSLVSEVIYSYYNGTNWYYRNKYNYEYDEEGNQTLYIQYNYEDGNWTENEKMVWEYEGGQLQSMLHYYGNYAFEKSIYHYNEQGLCSEMIRSRYTSELPEMSGWKEYYKELYEYDDGKLLTRVKLQVRTDDSVWDYVEKTELEYDGNSNCTNISFYDSYDYDAEQWTYLKKTFDFTFEPTMSISNIAGLPLYWEQWWDLDVDIALFNELQQVTQNNLGHVTQYDFYYSNGNSLDEPAENNLSVWPNPATNAVRIEGCEPAEVQIYNALGQLVKTISDTSLIELEGLPKGVCLLKVTDTKKRKHTAKVVVK